MSELPNNGEYEMPSPATRPEDDPYSVGREERLALPAQAGGAPVTPSALESGLAKLRAKTGELRPKLTRFEAAALLAKIDAQEWRPMETAPKDGTWFLAWRAHATRPRIVRWDATHDAAESEFGEHVYHLERWMPLPAYRNPAPAGICTTCGGEVHHRAGKPGEFDHQCNPAPAGDGE